VRRNRAPAGHEAEGRHLSGDHATKHRPKSFAYDKPQQVYLGIQTIAALKPHADARGIMPTKLVQMLIDIVVRDGMVDAVLDDQEPVA
jgi:hypothetical protein